MYDGWRPYEPDADSTVTGILMQSGPLPAPSLGRDIELTAWLPQHHVDDRFPVLYMHDGGNLFDEPRSYSGEWGVDETMTNLADEGIHAIVVGIANAGEERVSEYMPWEDNLYGFDPRGVDYVEWLVGAAKPFVDATLQTVTTPEATGTMGSSLGGLISLYAFHRHPEVFSRVGAMSSASWMTAEFWPFVQRHPRTDGKVYVDVGTNEIEGDREQSEAYEREFAALAEFYAPFGDRLLAVSEEGAIHSESAWRRRLPDALRFLLT
jgi:predicted alpha/beta superfamily hydrolase